MSDYLHHHALKAMVVTSNGLLKQAATFSIALVANGGGRSYDWAYTDSNIWLQDSGGVYTNNAPYGSFLYIDCLLPASSYTLAYHVTELVGSLRLIGFTDQTITAPGIIVQTATLPDGVYRFHALCAAGTTCRIRKVILKTA